MAEPPGPATTRPGRRPRSLRARVAVAAALGTVLLAVVVAATVAALLVRREVSALDQRLDAVAQVAARTVAEGEALDVPRSPLLRAALDGLVVTVRSPAGTRSVGLDGPAADLPARDGTVAGYRLRTVPGGDATVTVGLPTSGTDRTIARVRRVTAVVTALAAVAAAGLGWLLAGPAVRPLRVLADRTAALDGQPDATARAALVAAPVDRVRESADLSAALQGLLGRVEVARAEGERSLRAAQDFAAAAEHELRTPLTALGTDVEVILAHPDLPADQRQEVVRELAAAQQRMAATLAALAQLAVGELATVTDPGGVELTDLVATAVAGVVRSAPPGVAVTAELPDVDVRVPGSAAGLRLAVDNLLLNAVRHAEGTRVVASVARVGDRVRVTVDDDGRGVPADERATVFDRFRRGRGARTAGSGLGLGLVAQQARLHDGAAWLGDGPLGGTRAVLDLPMTAGPRRAPGPGTGGEP